MKDEERVQFIKNNPMYFCDEDVQWLIKQTELKEYYRNRANALAVESREKIRSQTDNIRNQSEKIKRQQSYINFIKSNKAVAGRKEVEHYKRKNAQLRSKIRILDGESK